jgi:hypothetical protein
MSSDGKIMTAVDGDQIYVFNTDSSIDGNVGIGPLSPETKLEVSGTMSGNAIYVTRAFSGAGLSSCSNSTDKLLWDSSTQRFSCGTDDGGGGGSGFTQASADARYVNVAGDSMTGALIIKNGAGLNASGAILTNGNLTLNSDNGAVDAVLTFGNSVAAATVTFNAASQRFDFTDEIHTSSHVTASG